jgi:hypothetical protein
VNTPTGGWRNNYHDKKSIKHFELTTTNKSQSSEEHGLLFCDSHDSHISADFVSFCIQNRVDLVFLPPHSSHLLQLLDVGVFAPLKRAISIQTSRLIRSGISRVQKVEWLERFIQVREQAITSANILAGWRGAGLFPENMHRILIQLNNKLITATPDTPRPVPAVSTPHLPNSSPPDPSNFRSINQAFMAENSDRCLYTSQNSCTAIEQYLRAIPSAEHPSTV